MKRQLAAAVCAVLTLTACTKIEESSFAEKGLPEASFSYDGSAMGEIISPVYESLSEDEKALYDKILSAVINFEDFVTFDPPVPRETARRIYSLVYSQERRYFWLSNIFYTPDEELTMLRINYLYTREDAELKRAELDLVASTIIGELPDDASDYEKVVFFHDRIVTTTGYSDEIEHVNSAYGVLTRGKGQCEGYASAMSLLCDKAGIPNYTVCGKNEDGDSHAWNKICLDGEWYNVDCTWDDPTLKRENPDFVRHDYLLVKDSEIENISHFTDENYKNMPACNSDKYNYFKQSSLVFDTAADGVEKVTELVKSAGIAGKREIEIRFSSADAYYAAMARFFDSGEMKDIIETTNANHGTRIRSAYKHNNDDLHIVHVSLIYESDPE